MYATLQHGEKEAWQDRQTFSYGRAVVARRRKRMLFAIETELTAAVRRQVLDSICKDKRLDSLGAQASKALAQFVPDGTSRNVEAPF